MNSLQFKSAYFRNANTHEYLKSPCVSPPPPSSSSLVPNIPFHDGPTSTVPSVVWQPRQPLRSATSHPGVVHSGVGVTARSALMISETRLTISAGALGGGDGEDAIAVGVGAGPGGGGPQPTRKATERVHAARKAVPSFILDISKIYVANDRVVLPFPAQIITRQPQHRNSDAGSFSTRLYQESR